MQYVDIQIPADHPAFAGHFPGNPLVPAVVLLDEILTSIARLGGTPPGRCDIRSAKFKRVVGPGDPLVLGFERTAGGAVSFELRSAANLVADGTVLYR